MKLTLRAYARHRHSQGLNGGTLQAVRQALAAGRITAEPGGRIDPREADRSWAATTQPRVFASLQTVRPVPPPTAAGWAPTAAQSKRWRACRDELYKIQAALGADWTRLGEPIEPTGHPRLDAFLDAFDYVGNVMVRLDEALQQYAFASPKAAEKEV